MAADCEIDGINHASRFDGSSNNNTFNLEEVKIPGLCINTFQQHKIEQHMIDLHGCMALTDMVVDGRRFASAGDARENFAPLNGNEAQEVFFGAKFPPG
jgi:hypothetical protein